MPSIGPMELIVVLVIALVIVGPKKLPELGRSLGSAMRGFKGTVAGIDPRPAVRDALARPAEPIASTETEPTNGLAAAEPAEPAEPTARAQTLAGMPAPPAAT